MADWKCPHCGGTIGEVNYLPTAVSNSLPPFTVRLDVTGTQAPPIGKITFPQKTGGTRPPFKGPND